MLIREEQTLITTRNSSRGVRVRFGRRSNAWVETHVVQADNIEGLRGMLLISHYPPRFLDAGISHELR